MSQIINIIHRTTFVMLDTTDKRPATGCDPCIQFACNENDYLGAQPCAGNRCVIAKNCVNGFCEHEWCDWYYTFNFGCRWSFNVAVDSDTAEYVCNIQNGKYATKTEDEAAAPADTLHLFCYDNSDADYCNFVADSYADHTEASVDYLSGTSFTAITMEKTYAR